MTVIVFNILALLLMLPLQTASYLKTLSHVVDHHHEHVEEVEHDTEQPAHSHDEDIWGLFAIPAMSPDAIVSELGSISIPVHLSFYLDKFTSRNLCQSLFRPPIA